MGKKVSVSRQCFGLRTTRRYTPTDTILRSTFNTRFGSRPPPRLAVRLVRNQPQFHCQRPCRHHPLPRQPLKVVPTLVIPPSRKLCPEPRETNILLPLNDEMKHKTEYLGQFVDPVYYIIKFYSAKSKFYRSADRDIRSAGSPPSSRHPPPPPPSPPR